MASTKPKKDKSLERIGMEWSGEFGVMLLAAREDADDRLQRLLTRINSGEIPPAILEAQTDQLGRSIEAEMKERDESRARLTEAAKLIEEAWLPDRSVNQICAVVDLVSLVLPKKVASEYLGDTLEDIADWHASGMRPSKIQLLGLIRIFWAVVYTLKDVAPAALSAAAGKFFLG